MEGRTLFNYGMQENILTMQDIKYMLDIVDSDLSNQDKATKLYAYCNYHSLRYNYDFFKHLQVENIGEKDIEKRRILLDSLTRLISIYQEYDNKGYFTLSKNPYKCTLSEIENRLIKINEVSSILNSNDTDYHKAEKLLELFDSSESFRKSYSLFIKYGKNDSRLISARQALDEFDLLLTKFRELEQKGIIENTKYVLSIKDYLQNYNYAKFVISNYISSSDSYKENDFLDELGIDKETFNYCIETIEELDIDLYNKYLEKKETNNKIRCVRNSETISDLANGIRTGLLSDGTPFELLEFIKRVPFKNSDYFINAIADFMKRNNQQDFNVIMSYIYTNKLNSPSAFSPIDFKSIYNTKTIVNGIEITPEANNIIIEYLKLNKIPLISKAYILARTKYINGEITPETIQQLREDIKSKADSSKGKPRILIPSNKE